MLARLWILSVLVSLPLAGIARAADSPYGDSSDPSGMQVEKQDPEHAHHRPPIRWAFAISPRYYGLNTNGYSGAFTGNGFSGPKTGTVGADFTFYWMTQTNWQVGFGFGDLGYSDDLGSSEASYSQSFLGFWIAKTFPICDDWELSLGGLFAAGNSELEVFSTSANGKVDESSFILEPKIIAAYRATPWFKVGVSASYLEPLAQTDAVKGTNVATGNISTHGISGGVEFIFGHFGREKP